MDEIIAQVAQKTGMSEDMAEDAVLAVVEYLKEKLPAPFASQISGLLTGEKSGSPKNDLIKGLGGLLD